MHLRILHRTTFTYAGKATDSFNEVRLRPVHDAVQTCRDFKLRLTPGAVPREYDDFYGNTVHYFEVPDSHGKLIIEAVSLVDTVPAASRPLIPRVAVEDLERSGEREMFGEFYNSSHYVPLEVELWREAQDALAEGRSDVWSDVRRLGSHVYRRYYVREILPWKAAEFLIFSDSFPRSLHFCVGQIDEFLRKILGETAARPKSPAARASRRLLADLQSLTITDVLDEGLHEFLMGIQSTLADIGDEVVQTTMFYPAESVLEDQQQQQQQ